MILLVFFYSLLSRVFLGVLTTVFLWFLLGCSIATPVQKQATTTHQNSNKTLSALLTEDPDLFLSLIYANLQYPSGLDFFPFEEPQQNSTLRKSVEIYDRLAHLFPQDYYAAMRATELALLLQDKPLALRNASRFVQRSVAQDKHIQIEANYYDLYISMSFAQTTRTALAYERLREQKSDIERRENDIFQWLSVQPYTVDEKVQLAHAVYLITRDSLWITIIVQLGGQHMSDHLPLFTQLATEHPEHVALQSALVNYHLKHQNIVKSLPYLTNLLNLGPANLEVEIQARKLLISYYHQDNVAAYDQAQPHLEWLKNNSAKDKDWANYISAVTLMQTQENSEYSHKALEAFASIDDNSLYSVQAQYYSAQILVQQKQYDQALKIVMRLDKNYQSHKINRKKPLLYQPVLRNNISLLLARIYHLQDNNALALSSLEKRNHQFGGNLESVYFQGMLNVLQRQYKIAEVIFRSLLEGYPNNAEVLNSLGYILVDNFKKFNEAKPLLEKANQLSPQQPHILDSLGWLYFNLKQYDKAIQLLTQALSLNNDPEILLHLSLSFWENNQKEEAKNLIKQGLKDFPDDLKIKKTHIQFFNNPM